jgi:hypothetical protein
MLSGCWATTQSDKMYWLSIPEIAHGDSLAIVGCLVKCYYHVQW